MDFVTTTTSMWKSQFSSNYAHWFIDGTLSVIQEAVYTKDYCYGFFHCHKQLSNCCCFHKIVVKCNQKAVNKNSSHIGHVWQFVKPEHVFMVFFLSTQSCFNCSINDVNPNQNDRFKMITHFFKRDIFNLGIINRISVLYS